MKLEFLLLWATMSVSLVYYVAVLRHRRGSGRRRLPPGPRPLPVLGNLLQLRGENLHRTCAAHSRVHGPVMCLKVASSKLLVVVSSRAAAREAYARHDRRFAARDVPDSARALGWSEQSVAWLPSSSPRWRSMRGIMAAHVSSPRSLAGAARGVRERKVRDLVGRLRAVAGQAVEVRSVLYRCMLNLLAASLFSVDVAGDALEGLAEDLHQVAVAVMKPNVSDVLPSFLRPLDLQGRRRLLGRHLRKVFVMLDHIIDSRLTCSSDQCSSSSTRQDDDHQEPDFLDTLLNLMSAGKISRDNVTNILFEVFGAGAETVATTVEWTMAELLRNPAAMAKARAEVAGAFVVAGNENNNSNNDKDEIVDVVVEERDAARLPYVQAALKESMRLHPVVPLLVHKVVEDGVEIGGYAVPKGCSLILNSWAIMRDPDVWDTPDEFRPERFVVAVDDGDERKQRQAVKYMGRKDDDDGFEFLPFGSGRRSCPGVPVVERVMPVILASLLHAFEWRLPHGVSAEQLDLSERFGTVTGMAVPLRAVPTVLR